MSITVDSFCTHQLSVEGVTSTPYSHFPYLGKMLWHLFAQKEMWKIEASLLSQGSFPPYICFPKTLSAPTFSLYQWHIIGIIWTINLTLEFFAYTRSLMSSNILTSSSISPFNVASPWLIEFTTLSIWLDSFIAMVWHPVNVTIPVVFRL